MFNTYGPFVLQDMTSQSVVLFFDQIKAADKNLQFGIGVYVVAIQKKDGLLPCYVGQTYNEFGARLIQHYKKEKFNNLYDSYGPLSFFLIARATGKGKVKKATEILKAGGGFALSIN